MVQRLPFATVSEIKFKEVYGSDRVIGPFYDTTDNKDDQLLEEIETQEVRHTKKTGKHGKNLL